MRVTNPSERDSSCTVTVNRTIALDVDVGECSSPGAVEK
jgi:hypothetical protein